MDERLIIRNALVLARVGGRDAVNPTDVAERCEVDVRELPSRFRSKTSLLTATAQDIVRRLGAVLSWEAGQAGQPHDKLRRIGLAYIKFARAEPGWFDVAFFHERSLRNARLRSSAPTSFEVLEDVIHRLCEDGLLPRDQDLLPVMVTCWAGVHGLATLATRGALRGLSDAAVDELAADAVDCIVAGITSYLDMEGRGRLHVSSRKATEKALGLGSR